MEVIDNNCTVALKVNSLVNFEACNREGSLETSLVMGWRGPWCRKTFGGSLKAMLTTANILYRRPDHPWLLQSYVWQDYDLCPAFPALNKFLNFWLETLEGPLHSVTVAHARLTRPTEIRAIDGEFRLH